MFSFYANVDETTTEQAFDSILSLVQWMTAISPNAENEMTDLIESFSFKKFSKAPTKYDPSQLFKLNAKRVHTLKFSDVQGHLSEIGLKDIDENFWNAVHQNIEKVADIKEWWEICRVEISPYAADKEYLRIALKLLPQGNFTTDTWKEWTDAIKKETGKKGKDLFLPLRIALTGKDNGPEMNLLLLLIGRDAVVNRLNS